MAEYNSVNLGRIMPKYTGDYSTNVNYNTLDIVFYEGSSYIATQPSLRQTPAIDSEYWGLISGKGDKGDKGDKGAQGDKGDTGPQGPAGKDGYMPVIGGRNLYLNSRVLSDSYGTNGNVRVTVEPFDSTTNMWHLVAAQGIGDSVGIYQFDYGNGKIPNNSDWTYSVDIKGTGKIVSFGIEEGDKNTVKGAIGSTWSRISQMGHVNEPQYKTIVLYFDTTDSPLDVYIKLPNLEHGNVATDWTPAPEDIDNRYVQKSGDTMTGNFTANRVTATDLLIGFHNVHQVPDTTTSVIDLINNDFIKGQGSWKEVTFISYAKALSDAPTNDEYAIIKLSTRGTNRTYVEYSDLSGNIWHTTATTNTLNSWVKQADDSTVVHNTGDETVAGNKTYVGDSTYMGTNTFMDGVSLNGKNVVNGLTDTDWLDIPLAEGRTGTAKYKVSLGKIFIHLDGVKGMSGVGSSDTASHIGKLPKGGSYYTRNNTVLNNSFITITCATDGVLYISNTSGDSPTTSNALYTDFVVI